MVFGCEDPRPLMNAPGFVARVFRGAPFHGESGYMYGQRRTRWAVNACRGHDDRTEISQWMPAWRPRCRGTVVASTY